MDNEINNTECCNLTCVIHEFHNQLKGYLIKNIKNIEIAEDLTQEVMLKLTVAHCKNEKIINLKAWLFQVARNSLIDHYRKSNKIKDIEETDLLQTIPSIDEFTFSPNDDLVKIIDLLPEHYAKPLYMSDIESIPQKVVAEKLGLNLSATKMRIQRARKMLYEKFLECCEIQYNLNGGFVDCTVKDICTPLIEAIK